MKAHSRFAAVLVVMASGTGVSSLQARTGETPVPPAAERDVQDIVCLGDKRQVLIRFHVQIGGKPLLDLWEDFMDKLFAYLDRNGDGVLSKDEAARVPPVQMLFNSAPNFVGVRPIVPEALDRNRDGTITRAELDDWYRCIGATPLQIHVVPVHNQLADRPNVNPTQLLRRRA
jgi:hypothetical protein